ncbi:sugar ABC transporter permease [Paenibacillus woosongensis]|uniref:ABC transporter permease n=1 Tax=Paenibacillus woosongensis TaxID=307580 RepID=A0A7X2YXS9_9BACL|nr:sugar ABC transporter permease [Paenibacillus woosongensis]MUG43884.1 ABC transporter permease subunit [Paenibacillus woosongensis]WHX50611.1 sugar ABC transporter permease [Paenibacillus woosongensis]GIP57093.1 ABC transporter permease [Paenibacillus woosongensis]
MKLKAWKPWTFLLPALLIYLAVIVAPSLYTLQLSFYKWNGISPDKQFVGLQNYIYLLTEDTVFQTALKNNVLWLAGSLTIIIGLGLLFALLLNRKIKGRSLFRGVFYFPYVLSGIIVALMWTWLYHPTRGFFNTVLEAIGLGNLAHTWLADPKTALYAVFIAAVWQGVGLPMVLFLAGLQSIPKDCYEAAIIDGARPMQSFRFITIPLLSETFVIVFATTMVNAMKVYDIIYGMTAGGPAQSTQVLSSWMYYQTFKFNNIGVGSAISWFLVLVAMAVIIPYVFYTNKKSHL